MEKIAGISEDVKWTLLVFFFFLPWFDPKWRNYGLFLF